MKVCVLQGSKASEVVESRLHPNQIVQVTQLNDLYQKFKDGCCNVIATDYANDRAELFVREMSGYQGEYVVGDRLFSQQPFAAATRKLAWTFNNYNSSNDEERMDDPHVWSEFVNWIIHALIAAEEYNITQATAEQFPQTYVFGQEYKDMFRHALAVVGNYGELYARTRETTVPRAGMNMINNGTTGLHYSQSSGNLADFGPAPFENGTIANILSRGRLRCGIGMPHEINSTSQSPVMLPPVELVNMIMELAKPIPTIDIVGTANIDVAYCRALSSAIFQGRLVDDDQTCTVNTHAYSTQRTNVSRTTLDLILLKDHEDGYTKLDAGLVDVIVGFRQDLRSDVWEQSTRKGFSFSQPFLFGPAEEKLTG